MSLFVSFILRRVFGCPGLDVVLDDIVFICVYIVAVIYESYMTWTDMSVFVLARVELD